MKNDPYITSDIESTRLSFPFYFISDTHLSTLSDIDKDKRIKDILVLLEEVRKSKGTLFVLGDFFDFWFSKGKYIPPSLEAVIELLTKIVDEGIEIHYIAGNHDFWLKGYIVNKIGLHFYPNALNFIFNDKRYFLHHGDRITYNNIIYPFARKLMRSWWAISLLKILPIKFTYLLGEKVSHYNREHDDIPPVGEKDIMHMKNYLWKKVTHKYDIALSGHVHFPLYETKSNKEIVILGDWIHHRTYGYMDEDGFCLLEMKSV